MPLEASVRLAVLGGPSVWLLPGCRAPPGPPWESRISRDPSDVYSGLVPLLVRDWSSPSAGLVPLLVRDLTSPCLICASARTPKPFTDPLELNPNVSLRVFVEAPRILPLSLASPRQLHKRWTLWVCSHQCRHLLVASGTAASPCYPRD